MRIDLEAIYAALPIPLQQVAVSIQGHLLMRRRYDAEYERSRQEYRDSEGLEGEALRRYQARRLSAHLKAAEASPFWRMRFAEHGVRAAADDPFDELAKLPVLSKEEAREDAKDILTRDPRGEKLVRSHTSGSTGSGLRFKVTRQAEREQWAVWWRYRERHGITRETLCGYFGGRSLVPLSRRKPPYHRLNRPGHQVMFSGYHLNERTAASYVETIRSHATPWLHGYPSLLSLLAGYVLDQDLDHGGVVQIVTTGAESLLPPQRSRIQQAFGCPVREHYGMAEGVANISECRRGSLHVDEDYALVEFVPTGDGRSLRIVGTNWSNPAFALLRYDTGDHATLSDAPCACGSRWRVVESIDGRVEDFVIRPDGSYVGRLDHCFKDLVHVREAQIYQPRLGEIVLRVVKGRDYDRAGAERELRREITKRVGEDMKIEVQYVPRIARTASGKLRFVVSDVR